ncbi:MAG: hypothetical protein Q8N99_06200 [Nanoarchaeota archaeon]|nr:hypothetical protein [Nanoarchaeota archaeon]
MTTWNQTLYWSQIIHRFGTYDNGICIKVIAPPVHQRYFGTTFAISVDGETIGDLEKLFS